MLDHLLRPFSPLNSLRISRASSGSLANTATLRRHCLWSNAGEPLTMAPAAISPFLQLGAWPLIMGGTMFLQQKLNPPPPDPVQARMFQFMPLIFTFMLARFPAGLVIYWTWNNLLSIAQQWLIMRRTSLARPGLART